MNKKEFIGEISRGSGLSELGSERALERLIHIIQNELKTDAAKCKVPGLGTSRRILVKERTFKNLNSKTTVPAHYAIKFKAAKEL